MLNACPKCQRTYPAEQGAFCPEDATQLQPIDQVPMPSDANDPYVGHTIAGRYELRRVVADGGMGRVYEGREKGLERRIAVKILHPHIAEDTVNIERFKREADTSASLDHAHTIEVFHFDHEIPAPGRAKGAWYLVMEYLDGEELRATIDRQKVLPLARTIRIIAQASIALDGAHAKGLVHRDLKPDNIFLVRTAAGDRVKLLDFGSVKYTKGQDKGQKLTVMGTTLGSPFYMSPEQAKGMPDLDHRADVWALGCILYEMQVGQVPFYASNGPQILFKILGEEAMPPSFAKDDAPPQLDDVLAKALHKERAQRYQSCGEMADALGHAFRLPGNHRDWAAQSEQEIEAKLRMSMQPAPAPTAQPQQGPAGVGQPGVGGGAMPFPMSSGPTQQPGNFGGGYPTAPLATSPDNYSPVSKPPVGLYVGIAAVVVVVLTAIVALVAMR